VARRAHVERVLHQEELKFAETLTQGMRLLEEVIAGVPAGGEIPGETVFKLYDTYGFPEDLTADIARERNLNVDRAGFDRSMDEQRARARKASRFASAGGQAPNLDRATEFLGYEQLEIDSTIASLYDEEGHPVDALEKGRRGTVVLERTPFYAESGGQIGDTGTLRGESGTFNVTDTQKLGAAFGHVGLVMTSPGGRYQASKTPPFTTS
jgi:alanyl-tRNA synthetase